MDDGFGCALPEEEAVCTSTSEEENAMFGPLTPYDPTPKISSGVSPLLAERYGFGRRCDVYSPINWGGKETYCPSPSGTPGTPTTSRGTYRTQPRQGTYVAQPAGQPVRGTYGIPGGQEMSPLVNSGRATFAVPSSSNRGTYGVPSTPQRSEQAEVAAEILAKFQSSCGSTLEQLKRLVASTPISGVELGTFNSTAPSSGMSGYDASVSNPSGGGFSPPPYGMGCPSQNETYDISGYSSQNATYDISSDAVSPGPCPKTPANSPRRPRPPPPSGKAATCGQPCPQAEPGPGNTNVVKPNLEDILNVVQFGMSSFLELRNSSLERLKCSLQMNQNHLEEGVSVMEGMNSLVCSDLASLPALIQSWNSHAQHLRDLHTRSTDPNNPTPNLSLIKHPSACVNQHAYNELLKSGMHLCQEVERGLLMAQIFYGKLDEIMETSKGMMMNAFNRLCLVEESRKSMAAEAQEWMRKFKETEHSVNNFLCEWQKGGDHLDQPVPETCAPPILDLEDLQIDFPSSGAENSQATYTISDYSPTSEVLEETKTPCAKLQSLQKDLQSTNKGLESLIERFNSMNSSIHQEVQQNIDQQEVLNESMRAMDDIPPPAAPQNSPA